ncbi:MULTISPECIES: hypothetical protein [Marinomonas]|uniref:Uncharacterized protein n=1 Tax=Marinomonas rhodophyticola TaxID=2992803 RepID=A0ABT3KCY6_9GAMM|nr:hypothetical protein [Marinomonas sp. KJ51-3]MCW4628406.1 hypothetical protein [Marinomonas sp. KJ51-3]
MHTLTTNDAKRNFDELEAMKLDYLKHYVESAKKELDSGDTADGEAFLNTL